MLILSCKIALRDLALLEPPQPASPPDDGPLLAAALTSSMSSPAGEPASMPSLTSLRLELSEPLSAKLIKTLLRSSLVGKVEDLGISARFIRLGLMADVVELPEVELVCRWLLASSRCSRTTDSCTPALNVRSPSSTSSFAACRLCDGSLYP